MTHTVTSDDIERAANAVAHADLLLICAGAGASADSGLCVFAQVSAMEALQRLGLAYDTIASVDCFRKDTDLFLGFLVSSHRRYMAAEPHEGYDIMHKWVNAVAKRRQTSPAPLTDGWVPTPSFCCTSNVDGFFHRSGFDAESIAEVHGSARRWQCGGLPNTEKFPAFARERCTPQLFPPPSSVESCHVDDDLRARPATAGEAWPPRCPHCSSGLARPNVYLFGDGNRFVQDESVTRAARFRKMLQPRGARPSGRRRAGGDRRGGVRPPGADDSEAVRGAVRAAAERVVRFHPNQSRVSEQ